MSDRGIFPLGVDPVPGDLRLAPRLAASLRKWCAGAPFLVGAWAAVETLLVVAPGHPAVMGFGGAVLAWGWLLGATAMARETFDELRGNRLIPWPASIRFAWGHRRCWLPVVGSLVLLGMVPAVGVILGRLPESWEGMIAWVGGFGLTPVILVGGCAAALVLLGFAVVMVLGPAIVATTGEGWVEIIAQILALCFRRPVASVLIVAATLLVGTAVLVGDLLLGTAWVHMVLDPGHVPTMESLVSWGIPGGSPATAGATHAVRLLALFHGASTVAVSSVLGYLWLRRHLDGVCLLDRPDPVSRVQHVPHAGNYVEPSPHSES